jgi:uncharacterized protein (TIGR02145 family)
MKKRIFSLSLIFLSFLYSKCFGQSIGTLIDERDGKKYKTVKIDRFEIMAENLNYSEVGICYDTEDLFCSEYGRLYDYYDVSYMDGILCPPGWHVPSEGEWKFILTKLNGKVETTAINYLLHQNDNPLKLQVGGYGRTNYLNQNQISFLNLGLSGFYCSSTIKKSMINGKEIEEWVFLSFTNNLKTDYPQSEDYKFTYKLGLTSHTYNLSCRCIKNYK